MKDKSIIWMVLGGLVLWVFFGYPPARAFIFNAARVCWTEVMDRLT